MLSMNFRYFLISILVCVWFFSIGQMQICLNKNWTFTQANKDQWKDCSIPGNNFTALLENHLIPDPYFSNNEKKVQWVSQQEWWFKTSFEIDSAFLQQQHIQLDCPGLDTYCSVYLNNQWIGDANNAFRHWSFDAGHFIQPGRNELLIKFQSIEKIADSLYATQDSKLPGESRVMVRKPQFHFGWDFGPKLISSGITDSVYIRGWNSIQFQEASIHTLSIENGNAELKLNTRFFIQDTQSAAYKLQLNIGDRAFLFPIQTTFGLQTIKRYFTIKNAELWWPNESGKPYLYPCSLKILKNNQLEYEKKWKTGIRTIELSHELDPHGQSFYFVVNGKKIFCKGANYIPQDILGKKTTTLSTVLQTAIECHFNMLRVWGGGQYEREAFYDSCDEAGIMIWQDFMYACGMYPGDTLFQMNARIEAEEQVERLAKHACMALWCGNNESNEGWKRWGWQDNLSSKQRDRIWKDYLNLFYKILPESVDKFSNLNSYWASSPLYGRGDDRFTRNGDAHDWGLWHDGMTFENLEKRIPRFMSEFGFQSLPSLQTIKEFSGDSLLNAGNESISNHQKHSRGNKIIHEYLERDFPKPESFESLVYLNQIMQAEGISKLIHAHRIAKPYCMGSLYWQFNDCWPGISWSGLDYYGRWKALQHKVKMAFEPLKFVARFTKDEIIVYALSDLLEPVDASCEIIFQDFTGNPIFYESWKGEVPENKTTEIYAKAFRLKKLDLNSSHYVLLKWKYNNQSFSEAFVMDQYKNLKLKDPAIVISDIQRSDKGFLLKLRSTHFAKSVYLSEDDNTVFFPNYFDLNPGETITVECIRKSDTFNSEKLHIQSLFNFLK